MTSDSTTFSPAASGPRPVPGWPLRIRLSLAALAVTTFALVLAEFLPAGLLTPMAAGLGISQGLAGQAVTATALSGMVSAVLVGFVIGRLDRKWVMAALCGLAVVSNLAAALAPSFLVLLLARILIGIAVGGFWSLAGAVVARLVSVEAIGKGVAVIMVGVSLATIVAPSLGALIAEFLGWRAAFAVAMGVAVLALAIELAVLPRLPPSEPVRLGALATVLRRPLARVGLLAVVAIASGHFAGFTYVRPILETVTRLAPTSVAEVLLAFGIANFFGNLAAGAIADRRLRLSLALAGGLIGLSALALAGFGTAPASATGAVIVWGFAFGGAPLVLQTYTARAAPDHLEAAGGLLVATFQISIALGAAVGGAIVDHARVIDVAVFTGVMGVMAASLAAVRLK